MKKFNENIVLEETEKDFGNGDLTLIVACTKCPANFELSKQSVVMAIGTQTSFIEYLRWIQGSRCSICNGEKKDAKV